MKAGFLIVISIMAGAALLATGTRNMGYTVKSPSGREVIEKLDELAYFKYAEPADIDEIKNEMINAFDKHHALTSPVNEETLRPKDFRLYMCDGEKLFELDGLTYYLEFIKPTFDKMGFALEWKGETNYNHGNYWDHSITLNGQEYPAFQGNMNSFDAWGIATKNFVSMLNDQLEKQGSEERVYPISGGNDGQIIFLTEDQFKYIKMVYKDHEYTPMVLTAWCKKYGLE